MQKIRRIVYLVMFVGLMGAAALHVLADFLSPALEVASVPVIRDFDDPVGRVLELVIRQPQPPLGTTGYSEPVVPLPYARSHGATVVAILLLVLGARRLLTLRADPPRFAPPSFAGFLLGLAVIGLALMILGWFDGSGLVYPLEPMHAGAIIVFLAFVLTELWAAMSAEGDASLHTDASTGGRRRPIWTVLGLVLPLGIGLTSWLLADRTPGLAAIAVLVFGVGAGLALGAIATVVALVRRERWVPLLALNALVNFGIGVPLLATVLSRSGG